MTREEALEILDTIPTIGEQVDALEMAIEALQERKTGKWISDSPIVKKITIDENGNVDHSCHCSECGDWLTGSDEYPCRGYYCPNCGAKMEVDE